MGCAGNRPSGALGWSLGGEAHVFIAGDAFARDFYRELRGNGNLTDSLRQKPLITVEPRRQHSATVLSASGAALGRLVLARFHARDVCSHAQTVTELVFAFPPGGTAGRSAPPSHVPVVALLKAQPFAAGAGTFAVTLSRGEALRLVTRVAQRADSATGAPAPFVRALTLDPDQAEDAGEVVPLFHRSPGQYAVGFRARLAGASDTAFVTGIAISDTAAQALRWVMRPQRIRFARGALPANAKRYSLRGSVAGEAGGTLLLIDEIADVSLADSRALAVDAESRSIVAEQPLALRCP